MLALIDRNDAEGGEATSERAVLKACNRRIHRWRCPPNWSPIDWAEEILAVSSAAAWLARREFDSSRGVPFEAFLSLRILHAAHAHYRREWSYALRFSRVLDGSPLDRPEPNDALNAATIRAALNGLSEADRSLLRLLFWEGQTETEVARSLGISQPAINRRKHAILGRLRSGMGRLEDFQESKL